MSPGMLPRSETRGHETFSSPNVFTTSVGTQPGRKEAGVPKTVSEQTERLKRHWEKEAPTYDRRMSFFERVLFGDGREWVCSRASGEVLEVAVGTGRNFPFYRQGVRLTGIDLSPPMLARSPGRGLTRSVWTQILGREMPSSCRFRKLLSTRWFARSPCATYPTIAGPSRR